MGQFLGVIVSKNGYQDGAITFAKSKGITLLTEKELPNMPQLIAGIIKKGFLPDKKVNGQCLLYNGKGFLIPLNFSLRNASVRMVGAFLMSDFRREKDNKN